MDANQIALEYIKYISESNKQLQANRFGNGWTAYISLISFFVLTAGAAIHIHFEPPMEYRSIIQIAFCVLGAFGIGYLYISQRAHNKNQRRYMAADSKIIDLIIQHEGLKPEDKANIVGEYGSDFKSILGRWSATIILSASLAIFSFASGFIINNCGSILKRVTP